MCKYIIVMLFLFCGCASKQVKQDARVHQNVHVKAIDLVVVRNTSFLGRDVPSHEPFIQVSPNRIFSNMTDGAGNSIVLIKLKDGQFINEKNEGRLLYDPLYTQLKLLKAKTLDKTTSLRIHPDVPYATLSKVLYTLGWAKLKYRLVTQDTKGRVRETRYMGLLRAARESSTCSHARVNVGMNGPTVSLTRNKVTKTYKGANACVLSADEYSQLFSKEAVCEMPVFYGTPGATTQALFNQIDQTPSAAIDKGVKFLLVVGSIDEGKNITCK